MPLWAKYSVLGVVMTAWLSFIIVALIEHIDIPIAVWSVPGATCVLLSDKKRKGDNNDG